MAAQRDFYDFRCTRENWIGLKASADNKGGERSFAAPGMNWHSADLAAIGLNRMNV
jgi:hypothetical protein